MPRIDADLKLDFKDVLLRPKRSSLKSRAEVDLERTFTFRNSKQTYSGIPIIVANMDTVGTFEMAVVMSQHSMFTAIHKHYTLDDWKLFAANHPECLQHVAVSSGSGKDDLEKMSNILEAVPQVKFICLDVANGYSEHFVEFVKLVRSRFPEHTIMAGNVVTGEMVEELILSGADIIKVGVGPEFQATAAESLPTRISQWSGKGERPILNQNQRFRVHHPHQDRGGLPPAERCDRVRRLGPRPEGAHHLGEMLRTGQNLSDTVGWTWTELWLQFMAGQLFLRRGHADSSQIESSLMSCDTFSTKRLQHSWKTKQVTLEIFACLKKNKTSLQLCLFMNESYMHVSAS
ncbi:GMP reductase 1 isoform X2 [Bos mutus]|uniref:GMP reductase 1 isoform X2 n=1 Tax=Bos mutus TaxID=72004 RepID=UPI0038B5BAC4